MDYIVNRESIGMKLFSSETYNIADEMEAVCAHLQELLYDANDYMQDKSAQEALSIVQELVEETTIAVSAMRIISDKIKKSAELLEESDTLL